MKLNIFSIQQERVTLLKEKFAEVKMEVIHTAETDGWQTSFYFSKIPDPVEIPWVNNYSNIFNEEDKPTNKVHYGAFLWEKEEICYGLSFGKSHFYFRQFCDSDFGLQMATRIGNKEDVTQKAARKFVGKKKREVRSYSKETPIDIESGESIDYIQSGIIAEYKDRFGTSGKFGTSLLLTLEIEPEAIPDILDNLYTVSLEEPKFKLPKIEIIRDQQKIAEFDTRLIEKIKNIDPNANFNDESHYIVGIDFVFPSHQKYKLTFKRQESEIFEQIDIFTLKQFIVENNISDDSILNIRLKVIQDDARPYSKTLKQSLDFTLDDQRVMLADGEWKEFNEDYINQLHSYIDSVILLDNTFESNLKEINVDEPSFNGEAQKYGYSLADKDFSIINLPGHTVEAWDLKRAETVYAVKFGTAQKIGYVCDQAINTLELMRNVIEYRNILKFDAYCLWLGLERVNLPSLLSGFGSIILKQKLETWARKCRELGINPVVRLSKKI